MLKKLLKYDFLSIKRFVIPLLLLTPAVAFAIGMIGYLGNRIHNSVVEIGLETMYVIGLIALFLSIALLPVLLIVRYYIGMFGDAGYVTLLLPVPRKLLLLSKVLYAVILTTGYLVVAFFSIGFAFFVTQTILYPGHTIFYAFHLTLASVKGLSLGFLGDFNAGVAVELVFYVIFLVTFIINLFYTGVTLGAVVFQGKAKIGGAIGFCIAAYMAWSLIKTLIEAIPTMILVTGDAEELLGSSFFFFVWIAETVLYACFSVGLFFLNARLIDRKLNLA